MNNSFSGFSGEIFADLTYPEQLEIVALQTVVMCGVMDRLQSRRIPRFLAH